MEYFLEILTLKSQVQNQKACVPLKLRLISDGLSNKKVGERV